MILAIDVHYKVEYAKTIVLLFENWQSLTYSEIVEVNSNTVAEYIPGEFYKRELPCILEALNQIDSNKIEAIIIDGYVYIDDNMQLGLGGHLHQALDFKIPVIGVAKTSFKNNKNSVIEVFRGESKKPLYVSAIGYDHNKAAQNIQQMYGEYRLPYLLKLMDQKTKEN